MRCAPFFIVIPLLLALTFVPWRSRRNLPLYLLVAVNSAVRLATFAPKLLWNIPGMSLSRFWINDFKNFVPLTMIILGSLGLKRLLRTTCRTVASWWDARSLLPPS